DCTERECRAGTAAGKFVLRNAAACRTPFYQRLGIPVLDPQPRSGVRAPAVSAVSARGYRRLLRVLLDPRWTNVADANLAHPPGNPRRQCNFARDGVLPLPVRCARSWTVRARVGVGIIRSRAP